jgi:hypothetical protein
MEENMVQENSQTTSLQSLWNQTDFSGKAAYRLSDDGAIVLTEKTGKERTIGTLAPDSAEAVIKALRDKYTEVEAKVSELKTEWDASEDKLKLIGKVERMKDYLNHTNALGDIETLSSTVAGMDFELKKLIEKNYEERLALVQKAESLVDSNSWKETSQAFRDFTEQWKAMGYVEKHLGDELWNRLEAARAKFFDRKRQNQEDINKDMLQNLDLKMELVERAENLAASENWKETTEVFKLLIEDWKKIGRTIPEKNEELWNRFITAKNSFYDRKKAHFDTIQSEQEANYATKLALVERAEAMKDSREWNATSDAYAKLMEEWKSIGRVPHDKTDEIWARLNAAKDTFFQAKKQHFGTMKVALEDNYAQKLSLLKRAESLENSNNWREATVEMNELMVEWKKIGPVPREHSNALWEKFLGARKRFFDRKDANREHRKQQVEKQKNVRFQQTRNFLSKLEDELREEEEKLADFKNGIQDITPGPKAEELRLHLQKLIAQTENKVKHKKEKLEDVRKQYAELEKANNNNAAPAPDADTAE